jgi:hypothetical protein|uniref:Uncharacterized protein n=1 Tax=viral metagenome TaxID=1070528 RepID=A0A6C0BA43_9ZZZZ
MFNLFKLGGTRRKQQSRKNRKSRRRRSYKGGAGGESMGARANTAMTTRR